MKYFQRALNNTNSYCECKKSEATYFTNSDGDMKPIGQLLQTNVNNNFVANVPKPTHKPLGRPSMDEMIKQETEQRNSKFDKKTVKQNNIYDANGLPSMDFLIKNQNR